MKRIRYVILRWLLRLWGAEAAPRTFDMSFLFTGSKDGNLMDVEPPNHDDY